MKKRFAIFPIFILFLMISTSCDKKERIVVEERHENGNPKIEKIYTQTKDGEESLQSETHYWENGKKRMEGFYKEGIRHDQWIYWFNNGNVNSKATYKDGELEGIQTVNYPDGTKFYEGNYKEGKRTGKWKFWNNDGTFSRTVDYTDSPS